MIRSEKRPGCRIHTHRFILVKGGYELGDAGHEVAFGQKIYKKIPAFHASEKPIRVVHGKVNIGVKGEDFDCLFSMLSGGLGFLPLCGERNDREDPDAEFLEGTGGQ